jgi:hypothetical protein
VQQTIAAGARAKAGGVNGTTACMKHQLRTTDIIIYLGGNLSGRSSRSGRSWEPLLQ